MSYNNYNIIITKTERSKNMSSEMELKSMLIDDYDMLMYIRKTAEKEGAAETIKAIDYKISIIKLKLSPLELPENQP